MTGLVKPTSAAAAIGSNRRRIRILEASGIDFGTNLGDWIIVDTNDRDPDTGINVRVRAGTINPGVDLTAVNSQIIVFDAGEPDAAIGDRGGLMIFDATDTDGEFCSFWIGSGLIANAGPNNYTLKGSLVWIRAVAQTFAVVSREALPILEIVGNYRVNWLVNDMFIKLANTAKIEVQNSAGTPIFRVNQDGSLQGKLGQTLTFDL